MAKIFVVFFLVGIAVGIQIKTKRYEETCVTKDVTRGSKINLSYTVFEATSQTPSAVSVRLYSPNKSIVYAHDKDADGQFNGVVERTGEYSLCFRPYGSDLSERMVSFEFETTKQTTEIADLKPIEKEIHKLQETIARVKEDMNVWQMREISMRGTSESTNARVLWLSIFTIIGLIGVSLTQIHFLKQFFQAKKLV